ncbi:MAG: site-specific integrase, partial [Myxococcales bacterium]
NAFGFTGIGSWAINDKAIDHALLTDLTIIAQRTATKRAIHQNRARAARGLSARSTSGQGGQEMCATALRGLFSAAFEDGKTKRNPAARLNRGARGASRRHALNDDQLAEVFAVVAQGGDDPALDQLLFWAELELGARRGGVLGLTMGQLHDESQMISLLEKGNKERLQPCSVELLGALRSNAEARGGARCVIGHPDFDPAAPVLYFKDSTPAKPHPVTSRRFDTLHRRIQLALPWANDAMFSGHALRHTSATMIERIAGFQSAQRFLGHHPNKPTDTYTIASPEEVATAWSTMTGKAHPAVQSNSISR